MQTKFIFITGGVVSGLGKGIAAASLSAKLFPITTALPASGILIPEVSVLRLNFL